MALTNNEILQIKGECGFNVVGVGAEVYLLDGYAALFDRAIQPYLVDPSTSSTTVVTAASTPTTVPITLASNPATPGSSTQSVAFIQGANVTIDVGPNQESAVIQVISSLTIYVQLSNAHGTNGAYPVVLTGSEQYIRDILTRIAAIRAEMLNTAPLVAGFEQIDEVKIYGGGHGRRSQGRNRFDDLLYQRYQARLDLCAALGIPYLPDLRKSGMQSFEVY